MFTYFVLSKRGFRRRIETRQLIEFARLTANWKAAKAWGYLGRGSEKFEPKGNIEMTRSLI